MANSKQRPRTHEERHKFPLRVDLTIEDCKRENFSGIRQVAFDDSIEIWILGSVRRLITKKEIEFDPQILEKAMAELVGI